MQNPPPMRFQLTPQGILPYDRFTASKMEDFSNGQVFTAKASKGRKISSNGAYWAGLHVACKASGAWPTSTHLHEQLKRLCGYVEHYHDPLTGQEEIRVQSTAFDNMDEAEFKAYFRLAQERFISIMGFDPWAQENQP